MSQQQASHSRPSRGFSPPTNIHSPLTITPQFSAVMHVDQVTTPLLILHGEADMRVPTFQAREFYVLLAERGKTVRMVTYPGSPHFPRVAEQRRDVMTEVQDWLKHYNP